MSLFKRRSGRDQKKKPKREPAKPAERSMPTLGATPGETRWGAIKDKVQHEVCAVLARTILELIRSSHARTASTDDLVRRQAINRLYADVLYDFLSSGEAPTFDPADKVLGWAREAMATWGAGEARLDERMAGDKAALSQSILAALETASRDETLRKAALERIKAARKAPTVEGPATG
jgi:hypothetical protein